MEDTIGNEPSDTSESVATFSIGVTFSPRTMDPAAISCRLGLEPTWQWRAGERVRNPNGTLRPYRERESRWSLITEYYDRREDDLDIDETHDALGPRLNDRLSQFLKPFIEQSSFVRELVSASDTAYVCLGFPGQFHFGLLIEPATLSAIADLGLQFGIEIFPNSAT